MSDLAWIDAAITAARPQAIGALLRYFRDLDTAEEAFQEACLRALKSWPANGPPRDPTAWLILVGRNAALSAGQFTDQDGGGYRWRLSVQPVASRQTPAPDGGSTVTTTRSALSRYCVATRWIAAPSTAK